MVYKPLQGKNRYRRFECHKHALLKIPECCTYFSADILEELVLTMINKELMRRGEAAGQAASFDRQIHDGEEELLRLEEESERLEADMKQVIRFSHMEELTQELVDTFVKKIFVYKDKRVEFQGEIT